MFDIVVNTLYLLKTVTVLNSILYVYDREHENITFVCILVLPCGVQPMFF